MRFSKEIAPSGLHGNDITNPVAKWLFGDLEPWRRSHD